MIIMRQHGRDGADATAPTVGVAGVGRGGQGPRRAVKTSERVAQDIVQDVVARGLTSGDRLPLEAAMVEEYQASRASVREALRLLEVQGLIRLKPGPGGGPVVGTVDPAHFARTATLYFHLASASYGQLLETQAMLEPLCARQAAGHPDRRVAMRPFEAAAPPADDAAYTRQTHDFHAVVYRLAGNSVLTHLTRAITHIVTDHVIATMDPRELRHAIVDEHVALARAISAGQADHAGKLMAAHFAAQHAYYRERWPSRLDELVEWR